MKRILIIAVLCIAMIAPLAAQSSPLQIDAGAGLSFAYIDGSTLGSDSEFADAAGLFLTLLSLRGGVNGSARFMLSESLSVGGELGLYYMTVGDPDTGNDFTFIDIPLRATVRMGKKNTFIQGFGGYYLALDSPFGGVEAGAKVSLGGLYLLGAYTIGEDLTFPRFEIGYCANDLLGF